MHSALIFLVLLNLKAHSNREYCLCAAKRNHHEIVHFCRSEMHIKLLQILFDFTCICFLSILLNRSLYVISHAGYMLHVPVAMKRDKNGHGKRFHEHYFKFFRPLWLLCVVIYTKSYKLNASIGPSICRYLRMENVSCSTNLINLFCKFILYLWIEHTVH